MRMTEAPKSGLRARVVRDTYVTTPDLQVPCRLAVRVRVQLRDNTVIPSLQLLIRDLKLIWYEKES